MRSSTSAGSTRFPRIFHPLVDSSDIRSSSSEARRKNRPSRRAGTSPFSSNGLLRRQLCRQFLDDPGIRARLQHHPCTAPQRSAPSGTHPSIFWIQHISAARWGSDVHRYGFASATRGTSNHVDDSRAASPIKVDQDGIRQCFLEPLHQRCKQHLATYIAVLQWGQGVPVDGCAIEKMGKSLMNAG